MRKSILASLAIVFMATPIMTSYEASAQTRQELREDRRELRRDRREVRRDRREMREDRRDLRDRRNGRPAWLRNGGRYRSGGRYITDYRRYGLRAPRRGYRWIRYGNEYLLVSIASGLISSIIIAR